MKQVSDQKLKRPKKHQKSDSLNTGLCKVLLTTDAEENTHSGGSQSSWFRLTFPTLVDICQTATGD